MNWNNNYQRDTRFPVLLGRHFHPRLTRSCFQSFGLTILSQTCTKTTSLSSEACLLLTAAQGSKPPHWAGDLSVWMTSDTRNVLSGCPQRGLPLWCRQSTRASSQQRFDVKQKHLTERRRTKLEWLNLCFQNLWASRPHGKLYPPPTSCTHSLSCLCCQETQREQVSVCADQVWIFNSESLKAGKPETSGVIVISTRRCMIKREPVWSLLHINPPCLRILDEGGKEGSEFLIESIIRKSRVQKFYLWYFFNDCFHTKSVRISYLFMLIFNL